MDGKATFTIVASRYTMKIPMHRKASRRPAPEERRDGGGVSVSSVTTCLADIGDPVPLVAAVLCVTEVPSVTAGPQSLLAAAGEGVSTVTACGSTDSVSREP